MPRSGAGRPLHVRFRRVMGPLSFSRVRWMLLAVALAGGALLALLVGQSSGQAASVPLSIAVQGNHFVNGTGQTVRLLGVDHPSMEYACVDGYAYNDGHFDATDAAAIASWKANTVRVPLNEDCWLGINGQPNSSQGADPPLTMTGYRQAVQDYVAAANAAGLYVILDLHWTAPGVNVADGQRPMPDSHSTDFWSSVASTFSSDPAVVFDAFNEPFSPDKVNDPAHAVSWDCWKSGGCTVSVVKDSDNPNGSTYTAVGMQTIVNAIRASGAKQPILLGGLGYSNDLTGWLAHEPSDPLGQLAASFHVYQGLPCDNQACWSSQVAPVAAQVPVATGEFDQDLGAPSTFDVDYMNWADANGVGYLAWGWWVLSPQEIADAGTSAYYLLNDYNGTPAAPNGTNLHDHLLALAAAPTTTTPTTTTPAPVTPAPTAPVLAKAKLGSLSAKVTKDGTSISFGVKATQKSTLVITVKTVAKYLVAGKRKQLPVGSLRAALAAGKTKTVTLRFSSASHRLLLRLRSLRVQVTTSLTGSSRTASVSSRLLTLKAPVAHKGG
jgi:hypothetical protein